MMDVSVARTCHLGWNLMAHYHGLVVGCVVWDGNDLRRNHFRFWQIDFSLIVAKASALNRCVLAIKLVRHDKLGLRFELLKFFLSLLADKFGRYVRGL